MSTVRQSSAGVGLPGPSDRDVPSSASPSWSEASADDPTRVYLALIRMPIPTRELMLAQGIPAARLDPALDSLVDRGLVVRGNDGSLDVPSPISTMPRHALELERRASAARAAADELSRIYYAARARDPGPQTGVRVLMDLEDVAAATSEAVSRARTSVRSMRAMTRRSRDLVRSPLASHREPSVGAGGRPVTMRTVWDARVLELPGAVEALEARVDGGEAQRFLPGIPLSVVVVDDATCLLEWSTWDGGPHGLVGHIPGAVAAAGAMFDRFWELAAPMGRQDGASGLDARDATVLRLMAAGVADAGIARQTGFSQRTIERRVRALMERLGAQTRFQAAVQAVHRGWL